MAIFIVLFTLLFAVLSFAPLLAAETTDSDMAISLPE